MICCFVPQVNNYQAIIVSDIERAYAVFTYKCGEIEWSSVGENNLAVVGFNANGPFDEESEIPFKNYRLSGLRGVGGTIACEYNPITNFIVRLPSTQRQRNQIECIKALDTDSDILQGEKTYSELAEMLKPCPCTLSQVSQDGARFIRQANSALNCYVSTNPVEVLVAKTNDKLTLTQQCCYMRG